MKRYPPPFPKPEPVDLDYHEPGRGGIRRRPRPMLLAIALIVGGLALAAALLYGCALAWVFMRGMNQD